MSFYGRTETWKIVYNPKVLNGGRMGVALIEATSKQTATYAFKQQYAGEFSTIQSCTKLIG